MPIFSLAGIAATGYALYLLGPWPLIGFIILLLLFPIQGCIGKYMMALREKAMPITDKRVRHKTSLWYVTYIYTSWLLISGTNLKIHHLIIFQVRMMGEFLSNIKFLKFYAWEEPMSDIIKGTRYMEKVRVLDFKIFKVIAHETISCVVLITSMMSSRLILFHTFSYRTFSPK